MTIDVETIIRKLQTERGNIQNLTQALTFLFIAFTEAVSRADNVSADLVRAEIHDIQDEILDKHNTIIQYAKELDKTRR